MPKRPPTPPRPPDPYREEKRDAVLSLGALLSTVFILSGNVVAWVSDGNTIGGGVTLLVGRQIIAISLCTGVPLALVLSARIFYRHRIHLGAWMLMFGINALGMLLATQLFKWLHPSVNAAVEKMSPERVTASGINALLLAIALASALLVRGAVLLKNAHRMPEWMANRDEKNGLATPRMWLFGLFWITPIAWWALILCALYFVKFKNDSGLLKMATAILLVIVTTRIAVRFVLFEKNKHTSWRRRATGWPLLRQWAISAGMVCAGALTFYAYFFMTTRVQEDAFVAQLQVEQEMILSELQAYNTEPVPANENAETIYKLARTSLVPINWEWAKKNWRSPEAAKEVAKNLTALSYFRQGGERKEIDLGIDWARTGLQPSNLFSNRSDLRKMGVLEMRIAASSGDWKTAIDDFKAGLNYARHNGRAIPEGFALLDEEMVARSFASALFISNPLPTDEQLLESREVLRKYLDLRPETAKRGALYTSLMYCRDWIIDRTSVSGFPGAADANSMMAKHALFDWGRMRPVFSALPMIKLATMKKMDRNKLLELNANLSGLGISEELHWYVPISGFARADLLRLAEMRMLETSIGIKRYQRFHGRWPSKIEDCIPQFMSSVPPDPYIEGEFVHYEPSPPRVFCAGLKGNYKPETHGFPDENLFKKMMLSPSQIDDGDLVLFLGN